MKRMEKNCLKKENKGHIPIRTCISCGTKRNKYELIRLVMDAQGRVVRDDRSKFPGRGAYLCPRDSCWEGLKKNKRLLKAFGSRTPAEIVKRQIVLGMDLG